MSRNTEMMRLVLDHGAEPIPAALDATVDENNLAITEELIRKGADVNYNDCAGVGRPLMGPVEHNKREMVRLLLRLGADPTTDPEIRRMIVRAIAGCGTTRKCENPPKLPRH